MLAGSLSMLTGCARSSASAEISNAPPLTGTAAWRPTGPLRPGALYGLDHCGLEHCMAWTSAAWSTVWPGAAWTVAYNGLVSPQDVQGCKRFTPLQRIKPVCALQRSNAPNGRITSAMVSRPANGIAALVRCESSAFANMPHLDEGNVATV